MRKFCQFCIRFYDFFHNSRDSIRVFSAVLGLIVAILFMVFSSGFGMHYPEKADYEQSLVLLEKYVQTGDYSVLPGDVTVTYENDLPVSYTLSLRDDYGYPASGYISATLQSGGEYSYSYSRGLVAFYALIVSVFLLIFAGLYFGVYVCLFVLSYLCKLIFKLYCSLQDAKENWRATRIANDYGLSKDELEICHVEFQTAYELGYSKGLRRGFDAGRKEGFLAGQDDSYNHGYIEGEIHGYDNGYEAGFAYGEIAEALQDDDSAHCSNDDEVDLFEGMDYCDQDEDEDIS